MSMRKFFAPIIFTLALIMITSGKMSCQSRCVADIYNPCYGQCYSKESCNNCIALKNDCISSNCGRKRNFKINRHRMFSAGSSFGDMNDEHDIRN